MRFPLSSLGVRLGATSLAAITTAPLVAVQLDPLTTPDAPLPVTAPVAQEVMHLSALPLTADADGLEAAAIALADELQAVPDTDGVTPCPVSRLTVAWDAPPEQAVHGAHLDPLGPAPDDDTMAVNGIVWCVDAPAAYLGFEAARTADNRWSLAAVPYLEDEADHGHDASTTNHAEEPADGHDHGHAEDDGAASTAPAPAAPRPAGPVVDPFTTLDLSALGVVDPYASYEPQRTCSPSAKPGTTALRSLLLRSATSTHSLGIGRGCSIGGRSEHKEGRAFDWGANAYDATDRAAVDHLIARMLATDAQGNKHALARRMGVMYIIWNRQIWSAYRPQAGWRAYHGASPHTDHVHISLSWNGAMARTSLWRGIDTVAAGLTEVLTAPSHAPAGTSDVLPAPSGGGVDDADTHAEETNAKDETTADHDGHEHDEDRTKDQAHKEPRESKQDSDLDRDTETAQARTQRKAARAAEREQREAMKAAARAERDREREADQQAAKATRDAQQAARDAAKAAERAERDAAKAKAREDRDAAQSMKATRREQDKPPKGKGRRGR